MTPRPSQVRRRFGSSERVVTYLTPPKLSSLPVEREQLEFSSRSIVFPSDGPRLLRVWGPPDRPVVLGVDEAGDRWRVWAWGLNPPEARACVRAVFSLEDPIEEFYAQVRSEPVLRGTERRFRGLRLPRDASLFEALVHSVLGQQLSVSAANTIKRRLIERVGALVEVEGVEVPRIPAPAEILGLTEPGLRSVGCSGAKARTLLGLARREAAGAFAPNGFLGVPAAEAIARLDAEPGVGRWTAENALLRGVGRRDLFVAGDLGLRVALHRFGAVSRDASEEEARAWGDRHYPGWGSYATLYLWRRLVTEPPDAPPPEGARRKGGPGRSGARPDGRHRAG